MKYFLVFTGDSGDREDCSVYYSKLVIASSDEEALSKFQKHRNISDEDMKRYESLEMKPLS